MTDINLDKHWMPFSANRDFKANPRLVTKAEGIYYWNQKGEKIIDGSSGLFTTPLGHCRPDMRQAIYKQLGKLDYVPHFNTGHPLSFQLADELAKVSGFSKFFFTTDGGSAVDTSIKIINAYWKSRGQGRKSIFVSREKAYHGMNMGGVALSGIINNRRSFSTSAVPVLHLRHTLLEENKFSRGIPQHGAERAEDLQRFIDLHGSENIAACLVEPIAGGVGCIVPPAAYLKRLREICTENDILLVFDEVITCFGRTGNWFASHTFDVKPDMILMAKALTNGIIPMGAIASSEHIYDSIIKNADEKMIDFFHGYTYSAHPIACTAALATINIMHQEGIIERSKKLSRHFENALFKLQGLPIVTDIRNCGMLAAVELLPREKPSLRGTEVYQNLFWSGLHVKGTGDNLIIAPPFVMEEKDIDRMVEILYHELSKYKS